MIAWLVSVQAEIIEIQEQDGPLHIISGNDVRFTSYEHEIFVQAREGADIILRVKPHHDTEPAIRTKNANEDVISEVWFRNGWVHRENKPAYLEFEDRKVRKESWYLYGKKHRLGGPSDISYAKLDETFLEEKWHQNGLLHRTDGPAITVQRNVPYESWYIFGESVPSFSKLLNVDERTYLEQFAIYRKLAHEQNVKPGLVGVVMGCTAPTDELRELGNTMRAML